MVLVHCQRSIVHCLAAAANLDRMPSAGFDRNLKSDISDLKSLVRPEDFQLYAAPREQITTGNKDVPEARQSPTVQIHFAHC